MNHATLLENQWIKRNETARIDSLFDFLHDIDINKRDAIGTRASQANAMAVFFGDVLINANEE